MVEKTTTTAPQEDKLAIENLFKAAFARTKERLLSYILASLLAIGLVFGFVFVSGLVLGGIGFLIWSITQSTALTIGIGTVLGLVFIISMIVVSSWTALAVTYVVINKTKVTAVEAYKAMWPNTLGYVGVMIVNFFLLFGLLPFGALTLFILFLVWGAWSAFTVFVYIEKKKRGLDNIFMSKAIVSKRFWHFVVRAVVMYGLYYVVFFVLGSLGGKDESALVGILAFVLSFVAAPFTLSYFYEIYSNYEHPSDVGSKQLWIILSVIGWVIMVITLGATATFLSTQIPKLQEQFIKEGQKEFMFDKNNRFPTDKYNQNNTDVPIYKDFEKEFQNEMMEQNRI